MKKFLITTSMVVLSLFCFEKRRVMSSSLSFNDNEINKLPKKPKQERGYTVTATVYYPEPSQTSKKYWITADGSIIDVKNPIKHRWIGVSRNLLKRWGGSLDYGDKVVVKGISKRLDGVYTIRDCMNSRYTNRIDILVGRKDNIYAIWKNVRIYKIK